jgi:HEAT repeat protein
MGFFRRIFSAESGPSPRQIRRAVKQVMQTHGDAGTRVGAMERLASWRTPEAAAALLRRFTINTAQASMDLDEKKYTVRLLIDMGEVAVKPILDYVRTQPEVTYPIQALKGIYPSDRFHAALLDILNEFSTAYTRWPQAKAVLIAYLSGDAFERVAETVIQFLEDDDDDVCIAAVDYLAGNGDETIREKLIETFLAAEARPRVRGRILDHFCEQEWTVKGFRKKMEEVIEPPFYLTSRGMVKRKSSPES